MFRIWDLGCGVACAVFRVSVVLGFRVFGCGIQVQVSIPAGFQVLRSQGHNH